MNLIKTKKKVDSSDKATEKSELKLKRRPLFVFSSERLPRTSKRRMSYLASMGEAEAEPLPWESRCFDAFHV